jgi:hypothetical protein
MRLLVQTARLEDFLPHLLAAVNGQNTETTLPTQAAISYIRNAAILFCDKTGSLKRELNIDIQCGLSEYLIETPECDTILRISDARLGDFQAKPGCLCWNWGEVHFEFGDDLLRVSPPPSQDAERGLFVSAVVAPHRESCEVDYQLYSKYRDVIVDGALAEIYLMSNQPWSSLSRSDYRRRKFDEAVSRVSINRVLQGTEKTPSMRPNRMWMGSSRRARRF